MASAIDLPMLNIQQQQLHTMHDACQALTSETSFIGCIAFVAATFLTVSQTTIYIKHINININKWEFKACEGAFIKLQIIIVYSYSFSHLDILYHSFISHLSTCQAFNIPFLTTISTYRVSNLSLLCVRHGISRILSANFTFIQFAKRER